jgi:hypothetical protein
MLTHRPHRRIRTLVAALVALPMIGVLGLALVSAGPRVSTLSRAQEAERRMQRIKELSDVAAVIRAEQFPLQARWTARRFDVPDRIVSLLLGFDPDDRIDAAAQETDAIIERHGDDPAVAETGTAITAIRRDLAASRLSDEELFVRFQQVLAFISSAWQEESRQAAQLESGRGSSLRARLAAVDAAVELGDAIGKQNASLFEVLLPEQRSPTARAVRFVQDRSAVDRAVRDLRDSIAPGSAGLLDRFLASDSTAAFTELTDEVLSGSGPSKYSFFALGRIGQATTAATTPCPRSSARPSTTRCAPRTTRAGLLGPISNGRSRSPWSCCSDPRSSARSCRAPCAARSTPWPNGPGE